MKHARILLADDHQMMLDALKALLEPRYDVVGLVTDGCSLLGAAEKLRPDIVVVDIAMPQLNGLDASRQLRRSMPRVKIMFITMNEDPYMVGEAFRAGASAFLLKRAAGLELSEAIERVLKGGTYVTPGAAEGLTNISLRERYERGSAPEPTARQWQVIQLLAAGHTMRKTAELLHITLRTVAAHKYSVMERLHITSSAELVRYAIKHGTTSS
jgi:DNA-binding NarL/FixJ family response regulator